MLSFFIIILRLQPSFTGCTHSSRQQLLRALSSRVIGPLTVLRAMSDKHVQSASVAADEIQCQGRCFTSIPEQKSDYSTVQGDRWVHPAGWATASLRKLIPMISWYSGRRYSIAVTSHMNRLSRNLSSLYFYGHPAQFHLPIVLISITSYSFHHCPTTDSLAIYYNLLSTPGDKAVNK